MANQFEILAGWRTCTSGEEMTNRLIVAALLASSIGYIAAIIYLFKRADKTYGKILLAISVPIGLLGLFIIFAVISIYAVGLCG